MNSLKKDGEKKKSSMMSIPLTGERNLKWYLNLFYLQSTHHISVNEWVDWDNWYMYKILTPSKEVKRR